MISKNYNGMLTGYNMDKCQKIAHGRSISTANYDYKIGLSNVGIIDNIKDLSITLYRKLILDIQIDTILTLPLKNVTKVFQKFV